MSRRAQENVLAAVLLAVFGAILAISLTYGPRTRLVPVPVAAFAIVLVIAQIVVQNTGSADDLHVDVLEVLTRRKQGGPATAPGSAGEEEGAGATGDAAADRAGAVADVATAAQPAAAQAPAAQPPTAQPPTARPHPAARKPVSGYGAPTGRSPGAAEDVSARGRREAFAVVMVALLLALVLLLGPITGIFLFVLGYAAAIARMRWYSCLALSVGVSACLYLLFVELLNTQLTPGILPGLL